MMNNFRDIALKMDNVVPATSLDELLNQHRWKPSQNKSLRDVVDRHSDSSSKERRFLTLNTYCMDTLFATKPAARDRARELGPVIMRNHHIAQLSELFEDEVKELVIDAWREATGVPRPSVPIIRDGQDQALTLWRKEVDRSFPNNPYVVEDARSVSTTSSGLVMISQRDALIGKEIHKFASESGWDQFAAKGVMLTRIDPNIGGSEIEFYSTHLNAAGGAMGARKFQIIELVSFIRQTHKKENVAILSGDLNVPAESSISYISNPYDHFNSVPGNNVDVQIPSDLAQFVLDRIHSDDYPDGMTEYQVLSELLRHIGFSDCWLDRNGTPGYTEDNYERDEGNISDIRKQICPADPQNPELCDDFTVPASSDAFRPGTGSKRIDYIFISNPSNHHSFNLDFTRPRRTRYLRKPDAPDREKIDMISDHLGISMTLTLSPA